jgi:hypothetical protein
VLLMVPLAWLAGPERLFAASVALNLAFAALALTQLSSFISRRLGGFHGGLAALLLALCPSIWVAVASGLETPLVLCLQVGIWIAAEEAAEGKKGHLLLLAGLSILLILTRADGFLMPGLAAVFLFIRGRRRAALAIAATAAATLALLVLWRLSYYGWPLPNTYYAKVAGAPGARIEVALEQFSLIATTTGLLLHLLALLLLVLELLRRTSRLSFPFLFFLPWVGYWIYVGGDVFYERFLLILFPMGLFAILSLLKELRPRAIAAVAAAVCAVQLIQIPTDARFAYLPDRYDRWVLLGRYIGEHHPGATLASDSVGKVPYFSGLPTIDMLGLTDVHIAHQPPRPGRAMVPGHSTRDPAYVLSRRPDLIASWISYSLDMDWGLDREVYERAGYRVRYLLNAGRDPMEPNLIDAAGLSEAEISRKVGLGYGYAVLEIKRELRTRP